MDNPHPEFLHLANVLYVASYSVRDILWLRVLTVVALLCLSVCYVACGWWSALAWQMVFLAINVVQIGFLIRERRPVQLSETQRRLLDGPLQTLTPRQVQRFSNQAVWSSLVSGETLIEENVRPDNLVLLLSGNARVIAQGRDIASLDEGQFAGEMSFLTGGNTSARVVADGAVLIASWPESYVTDLMRRDLQLGTALQTALGLDLVKKLLKSRDEHDQPS